MRFRPAWWPPCLLTRSAPLSIREMVAGLLTRLDEVAGLEGWWITAEVSRVFGVHEWEELAGRRVRSLRRQTSGHKEALDRAASRYLG